MSDGRRFDPEFVRRVVREVVEEVARETKSHVQAPKDNDARMETGQTHAAKEAKAATPIAPRPERLGPAHRAQPRLFNPKAVDAIVSANPARLLQGRTGTRYLTEVYLGLRADHAIALDAVSSQIPPDWAEKHGLIPLKSRCANHEEFLLYPDHGRRLDDESKARLEKEGERGADIQIIAGDGLSAHALAVNGPGLLTALQRDLSRSGWKLARPVFVRHARIGVQDEIGVITGARCTVIMVGERPGLGTGDSLSIYTAFGPKLGQDNSEKDCISNVRELGFPPELASERCVALLQRTFAAGGGGVKLT